MGSRLDVFVEIRRAARVEGLSINALSKRFQVHRRTIRQALASPEPPARKVPVRRAPKLDRWKPHIDAMLLQDLDAPRKQVQTATRVWNRLLDEHHADVSYSAVRDYVRYRRPEIEQAAGKRRVDAFVSQAHMPAEEAEVDFGEVWVVLAGVRTKCYVFVFRLAHSGKAIHRVYPTQSREAFLEGHIAAFEEIGGVPNLHIKYDNLSAAVTKPVPHK